MSTATAIKVQAWHFLADDKRMRYGKKNVVEVGGRYACKKPLILCESGLHASIRAIDALQYAPGAIICRVELSGEILHSQDKLCASRRHVLAMADATNMLHEFACWCAENALRTAKVDDVRSWMAIETKRKWLKGEATNAELAAARDAAWDAAWDAARAAAWDAARDAALDAAWDAAWDAARDAAWDAALDAARDAAWDAALAAAWDSQNTRLEQVLYELPGMEEFKCSNTPSPS